MSLRGEIQRNRLRLSRAEDEGDNDRVGRLENTLLAQEIQLNTLLSPTQGLI